MTALGISDEVTTCECCGKKRLKCTVALDKAGETVFYGRDCAGAALYGRKTTHNTACAEHEARAVGLFRRMVDAGATSAAAAAEVSARTGRQIDVHPTFGTRLYTSRGWVHIPVSAPQNA